MRFWLVLSCPYVKLCVTLLPLKIAAPLCKPSLLILWTALQTKDREVEAICQADAKLGGDLSCACPEALLLHRIGKSEKEEALVEHRTRWPAIFAEIRVKLPGRRQSIAFQLACPESISYTFEALTSKCGTWRFSARCQTQSQFRGPLQSPHLLAWSRWL